jgi:hypothetical protein
MKKALIRVMFALVAVFALAAPAFASTANTYTMPDIGTAFSGSLAALWTNVLDVVTIVLPAGLAIMGIAIAIGLGKKFIKMFSRG